MKVICPKCGSEGWLTKKKIGGKIYYYVEHYEGKGKKRSCYIGPEFYDYVWRDNLGLEKPVYLSSEAIPRFLKLILKILDSEELLEKLAEIEHKQWMEWSQEIAKTEKISEERLKRWKKYWVQYNELEDKVKEEDRKWAREVINIIKEYIKVLWLNLD